MRTLLCAIPALLALAGTALAEPQQLNEDQLGGIAAGQLSGQETSGFNLSNRELNITSTDVSRTITFQQMQDQTLYGESTNAVYGTGINSNSVHATGSAFTTVTP
jgi:hypothetical protein